MSFCPKCGGEMGEGAQFCPKCGMTVSAQSQEASQTIAQPPPESQQPPHQTQPGGMHPQGPPPPQQPYGTHQQPYGAPQQPYGAPQQPYGSQGTAPMMPQKESNKTLGTVLIALGALIVVGIAVFALFFVLKKDSSGSPKDTVQSFYDAVVKGDYRSAYDKLSKQDQKFLSFDLFKMAMEEEGDLEDPKFKVLSEKINGDKATVETETMYGKETVDLVKEGGKWKISFVGDLDFDDWDFDDWDFDDWDFDDLDFDDWDFDDLDFDWDDIDWDDLDF